MLNKDLISVIIPVYNTINFLPFCLDSILNQSYYNLEIILIDDGSIDGSSEICEIYSKKDKRIKVIHQKNQGISIARNIGLQSLTGNYIAFIDSDDIIHHKYFEILLKIIKQDNYDFAACKYEMIWDKNNIKNNININFYETSIFKKENWYSGLFPFPSTKFTNSGVPYQVIWGKLYKSDLIKGLDFCNIWGEDREFNSKIYSKIDKTIIINKPLYYWVQRKNSAHRSDAYHSFLSFLDCSCRMYQNIPINLSKIKSQALKSVWLAILSSRYKVNKFNQYKNNQIETLFAISIRSKLLLNPLIQNKNISLFFKSIIIIFYNLPFTYNFFRWCAKHYANFKLLFKS